MRIQRRQPLDYKNAALKLPWLLLIAGTGIAFISAQHFLAASDTPHPPRETGSHSRMPSSVKPTVQQVDTYRVAADLAKYIEIPAVGVPKTRVASLGTLRSGEIATPNNIYDVGWYNGSARPGQAGAAFLYGHVSSWKANGVFYHLKDIRAGDRMTITKGDDSRLTYEVVTTKTYAYDKVDMDAVLQPIEHEKTGLNLMTCTGQLIKGTSEFSQRFVVFTKLVKT